MKDMIILGAILSVVALISAIATLTFMVNTIPATSSSGGDLFNSSVKSTVSYLAIPALFLIVLSFFAFLVWLFKMRG